MKAQASSAAVPVAPVQLPASGARRRSRRHALAVRGALRVPDAVMPWERELLLRIVLQVVGELFDGAEGANDAELAGGRE